MEGFYYTPHSDNVRILIIGKQVSRRIKPSYSYILHGSTDFLSTDFANLKVIKKIKFS